MNDTKAPDKSIIKTYPTKDLFISILVRDVTINDAIGDLLDNAVDGALRLGKDGDYTGLRVDIHFDPEQDYFKIVDNCGGIPVALARDYVFRFGRRDDAEATKHSVGAFGIGMKRALFRLGWKFAVESIAKNSSFKMEVDVEEWKRTGENHATSASESDTRVEGQAEKAETAIDSADDPKNWQFKFSEYTEDLEDTYPESQRKTTIIVERLRPDVIDAFKSGTDQALLISELQREHLWSIDQGMDIYVNMTKLASTQLELLTSGKFKAARWENLNGPVKVHLYAGISEQEKYGTNGGWYIFCNRRLVLGPDQTKITGWGAKTPNRIPEYHSQFYRFRGYAFFEAENPKDLPWNTAKTNVDLDMPVYKSALWQMIMLMRSVIDFLNQLHKETTDSTTGKIREAPLLKAIEKAKPTPLRIIRQQAARLMAEKFVGPKPAKKVKPKPSEVTIKYSIARSKYDLAKDYFDVDKPGEIGLKIFNYFFERELKD